MFLNESAFAQQKKVKADSTKIYKEIESFSKQSKFKSFMYRLLFKPVSSSSQKKVNKKLIQKKYSVFEGKIIRYINIETLDPFGYSITDTAHKTILITIANKLHVKSKRVTIRNLLLIRENQPFDSLRVNESERLVRSNDFVRDVLFSVNFTSKASDSVDINIRELDNWSIIPKGGVSSSNLTINLTDKNFAGLGHEFQNNFSLDRTTYHYADNANYIIPNIRNTYISSTLHYGTYENGNFIKSVSINRPFFSPFARWAAGADFSRQYRMDSLHLINTPLITQRYKFNSQDFWAGKATQLFSGNTEFGRTTNFIFALRFLRIRYLQKPDEMYDTEHFFSDEDFYFASLGVSTREYVKDKYIFNYGITEDVPIGKAYALTGGYQVKNNTGRLYLGARISAGDYYPWGYVSSSLECGTFMHAGRTEQGVITLGITYFTQLMSFGKWKFRQFIKPQLTVGINRYLLDTLTLNDGNGIDGFNGYGIVGTRRLLFTLQSQSYAPWNFIGFRFGPFFTCSFGMLGDGISGFRNSSVYSQFGLGLLIKNENLVINTFQISISFYPLLPGIGNNVSKINSFRTADFGFRDFDIGKPAQVSFR